MSITVCVMYPNEDGSKFDYDYYLNNHIKLVDEYWGPQGLLSVKAIKGMGTPNPKVPCPYRLIALIEFESVKEFQVAASSPGGVIILKDIVNFTDVEPVVQINENL